MNTGTTIRDVGKRLRLNSEAGTLLSNVLGKVALIATILLIVASSAVAQNTIYVDATNGSNLQAGTSQATAVATINEGLNKLTNGGTLIIYGDTYNGGDGAGGNINITSTSNSANNLTNLTIRFENGVQSFVNISGGTFTHNLTGNITFQNVSAYAVLASATGTSDLVLSNTGNFVLDAAATFRLTSGAEILQSNTGRFSGFAPQQGTNVNLEYASATVAAYVAGPEATQYTNLGNGAVVINYSGGGATTFTYGGGFTTTGTVTKTAGATTINGTISAGSFVNLLDNVVFGSGFDLTTTGNFSNTAGDFTVDALVVGGAFAKVAGNLTAGSIAVTTTTSNNAGNITVSGNASLTGATTHTAGTVAITGTLTIGADYTLVTSGVLTVTGATTMAENDIINNGSGAVTLGVVNAQALSADNTSAVLNLGAAATGSITAGNITFTIPNGATSGWDFSPFVSAAAADAAFLTVGNVTLTTAAPGGNATFGIDIVNGDGAADAAEMTIGNFSIANVVNGGNTHQYRVETVTNTGVGTMTLGTIPTMVGDLVNTVAGTLITGNISSLTGTITNTTTGTLTTSATAITGDVVNTAAGTLNFGGTAITGDLTNTAAGSIMNITGNTSVTGVYTNAGTGAGGVTVSSGVTLTLSGNGPHVLTSGVTKGDGIVSLTAAAATFTSAAATAGTFSNLTQTSGASTVAATQAIIVTNNLTIAGGTFTLADGATATTYLDVVNFVQSGGTFNLDDAAADVTGTPSLRVSGNFTRTSGTFTALLNNDGTLVQFDGTSAQTVTPGPLLTLGDLTVSNTAGTVTIAQSLRASGTVTFNASSTVDFGSSSNLILNGAGETFTNNGSYTQSSSIAGIYIGGVDGTGAVAVVGGTGVTYTLTGAGTYGNLFIANGDGNDVTYQGANTSTFTGDLNLVSGELIIANNATTILNPSGSSARVVRYFSDVANGGSQGLTDAGAGVFNSTNTAYDLVYQGTMSTNINDASRVINAAEFTSAVRNVTFSVTNTAVDPVRLPDAALSITGNLTVSSGTFVETNVSAARTFTVAGNLVVAGEIQDGAAGGFAQTFALTGASATHSVTGRIEDGGNNNTIAISITGANATLSGSGTSAVNKNIVDAVVNIDALGVSISNLQELQQGIIIGANNPAGLTLGLIDSDQAISTDADGLVTGTIQVSAANAATLTLATNVDLNGLLDVDAGTLNLATFNLESEFTNAGAVVDVQTGSTISGTGRITLAGSNGGEIANFDGVTVPNITVTTTHAFAENVTVSGLFDINSNVTGAGVLTIGGTLDLAANITTNNVVINGTSSTINLNNATRTLGGTLQINHAGTTSITTDAATLAVTGLYTQTAGTLSLNDNTLSLTAGLTYVAGTINTGTGNITTTGGASTILTSNKNLSLGNLTVAGATNVGDGTDSLTVTGTLSLGAALNEVTTVPASPDVIQIGNGATITRTAAAGLLSDEATFLGNYNLSYTGAGPYTAGTELAPAATILNDVTLNSAGGLAIPTGEVMTVNGKLTLTAGALSETGTGDINLATTSTVDVVAGTIANAIDATTYTLNYVRTGAPAAYTTGNEWTGTPSVTVNNATNPDVLTVTLNENKSATSVTVTGDDVLALGAFSLTNSGAYNVPTGGITGGTIVVTGTGNQTFTVASGGLTVNNFTVNLSGAPAKMALGGSEIAAIAPALTLTGGNLTVTGTLTLTRGIFRTGTNNLILNSTLTGAETSPVQGFANASDSSHVVGNVRKLVDVSNTAYISNMQFPVGNGTKYRPASLFFPTAPQSDFNLTVTYEDSLTEANGQTYTPGGINGLPVANGVGGQITAYPDFNWKVTSDVTYNLVFNMECHSMVLVTKVLLKVLNHL
jgi:fibronectin-binding autotransporter adhesin